MREAGSLIGERFKRRMLVGCLSALIGVPLMACLLGFLLLVVLPWLEGVSMRQGQATANLLVVGVASGFFVLIMGAVLAAFLITTHRRARAWDAIFTPFGLTGSRYMLHGRRYQGRMRGREMDVYFYRGPTLEIRLQAQVSGRLAVTPDSSIPANLAGIIGKTPLKTTHALLEPFSIFTSDEAWASRLVELPQAPEALNTLMTFGAPWAILRRVEVQPGTILIFLYRSRNMIGFSVSQVEVQAWVDGLEALARMAESLPPPAKAEQPSAAGSRQARQAMDRYLLYVILAIVIGLPVCLGLVGILAYILVLA